MKLCQADDCTEPAAWRVGDLAAAPSGVDLCDTHRAWAKANLPGYFLIRRLTKRNGT